MSLEIYLIRHAETETNIHKDKISGRSNWAELTENGIAQAKTLGERLRDEGVIFDAVYSSPAVRTQQTARYCLEAMGLDILMELEPALIEMSQGDWVGKSKEEIYSRSDVREGLDQDSWNYTPGDKVKGESQGAVAKRMREWIERIVKKHGEGRIAAFTHGLAIKYLLTDLFGLDKITAYKIPIDNTSITVIRYDGGRMERVKTNDSNHLDKAKLDKVSGSFDDPDLDVNKK